MDQIDRRVGDVTRHTPALVAPATQVDALRRKASEAERSGAFFIDALARRVRDHLAIA